MVDIKKAWLQTDYPSMAYRTKSGLPYGATVSSGGCGMVSVLNILYNYIGLTNLDMATMRDFAVNCGARYNGGTNVGVLLESCKNKFGGFTYEHTTSDEKMKNHVANGGFAVGHTYGGKGGATYLFSGSGHYVAMTGSIDNKIRVIDSYYYSGKWTQYSVRSANVTTTNVRGLIYAKYPAVASACDYYYLVTKDKQPEKVEQPKYITTTDTASMRQSNSSSSTKLGSVNAGVKISMIDETDNWYKCFAYIPKKNCTIGKQSAKVNTDCNVRLKNSSTSSLVGKVSAGITVDVLSETEHWLEIRFFVPKRYARR